jgi:hypothetical protein
MVSNLHHAIELFFRSEKQFYRDKRRLAFREKHKIKFVQPVQENRRRNKRIVIFFGKSKTHLAGYVVAINI